MTYVETIYRISQYYNNEKYEAIYRAKEEYLNLIQSKGFQLVDETVLSIRSEDAISFGGIFKKE